MTRGQARTRKARIDIMRSNARGRARKYDKRQYDKPVAHEGEGGKPKTEGGECTPLPKHVVDPPYLYIKNKIGGRKWLQINPQKNRKDLAGERSLLPKTYNLP